MTRNISLASSHSCEYSTDALIPAMPRKNRICKRIVTYCRVTMVFMMSNSINCRVHLCQMQVRWEFLRCKASHSWPMGCLLLHQHQNKPGDATAPPAIPAFDTRGLWKTGKDSIQRVKSGEVTTGQGRANNQFLLIQASVCHSGVFTVTANPQLSPWQDEEASFLSVKQWLKKCSPKLPTSQPSPGMIPEQLLLFAALWIPDTGRVHHPSSAAGSPQAQQELHNT